MLASIHERIRADRISMDIRSQQYIRPYSVGLMIGGGARPG
jgi:hypothetical protein